MSADRPGPSVPPGAVSEDSDADDRPDGEGTEADATTEATTESAGRGNGDEPNGSGRSAGDSATSEKNDDTIDLTVGGVGGTAEGPADGAIATSFDPADPTTPAPFVDLADVESPVVPPTEPPARWLRSGRSRGRTPRPVEGRWVGYRIRHIAPGSVFRMAGLFTICLWLTLVVAAVLLWNVGRSTETIDQFESFVTRLGAYGECVPEDELDPGTDFERDEDCPDGSVLVDGFRFDDGTLFRVSIVGGFVLVVGGTLAAVLMTMLYNLLSEVTGGVRYTMIREPRSLAKAAASRSPRPRSRR